MYDSLGEGVQLPKTLFYKVMTTLGLFLEQ